MKIVVTGGAGFIGANLCRELTQRRECEVVAIDDLSTGLLANLEGSEVDLRVGSILDHALLADACAGAHAIVHLAAVPSVPRSIVDPERSHDVNATGTVRVLEVARQIGAHVVLASSSSVYGHNPAQPKSEDMPVMPASPYAASKVAAESYARSFQNCYGLSATVFRFFNVFGPLQGADHAYAAVVPSFISSALRGEPLIVHGDGEQSRDFTFVSNVIEVLARSAIERRNSPDPINLAWGTNTSLNQLIAKLSAMMGAPLQVTYGDERPGDVRHSQAATKRLRRMFPGSAPVPFDDALRETVAWMASTVTVPSLQESALG